MILPLGLEKTQKKEKSNLPALGREVTFLFISSNWQKK
jgi:hypothetical protein